MEKKEKKAELKLLRQENIELKEGIKRMGGEYNGKAIQLHNAQVRNKDLQEENELLYKTNRRLTWAAILIAIMLGISLIAYELK